MKRVLVLVVLVLAMLPAFARAAATPLPPGVPAGSEQVTVTNYSDARAVVVDRSGKDATVILIGLDAPDPHHGAGGDCYAAEAMAELQSLLPVGATVYLETDKKGSDGQGHLLRYVWVVNPVTAKAYLLNTKLVRDGAAVYAQAKPDDRYDANLQKAQATAQKNHAGLWGACGSAHVLLSVAVPTSAPTTEAASEPTQAAPQGLSADEQAYIARILPDLDQMTASADRFTTLMQNPNLGDTGWEIDVLTECLLWQSIDKDVHQITPPPAFATVHDLITQAFDLYASAADDIANGINLPDASLLYSGGDKMSQANNLLVQATQELDNIRQQRGIA